MRVLRLAISTLVMTAAIAGQRPAHLEVAWDQFVDEFGPQWRFDRAPGTGTPMDIWGPGLRLTAGPILDVDRARAQAATVLQRFADVLGKGPTVFVEDIQAKTRQVWTFGYRQEYRGLPCITGRANIMINDVGVLAMFGSTALQIPANFDVTPKTALIQARAIAYQKMGLDPPSVNMVAVRPGVPDRLVVWGNAWAPVITAPRLAWEVRIDDVEQAKVGRAYIDARTGALLQFANDLHRCGFDGCRYSSESTAKREGVIAQAATVTNGTPIPGLVNVVGNVKAWVNNGVAGEPRQVKVNLPLENLRVDVFGGNFAFTDANGDFSIPNLSPATATVTLQLQGRYCAPVAVAQGSRLNRSFLATPGTPINIQLFSSSPKSSSSQGTAYWATDHVNQVVRARGGFINPQLDQILPTVDGFSACGGSSYNSYSMMFYGAGSQCSNSATPSLIYHEWAHGLDEANGGVNQSQGLSEGSADFLSMAILNDPRIGMDVYGQGIVARTGLNTSVFPVPANQSLYAQGQTWMGWGWDVYLNLQRTLGTTAALSLYRDYAVGFFAANPGTQDAAVRAVFVIDDNDGDLTNGTPNCNSLGQACIKRNLTNPATCQGSPIARTVGTGCPGSGKVPGVCISLNPAGGTLPSYPATGAEVAFEARAVNDTKVVGFSIFTAGAAQTQANFYLQGQATSTPTIDPVAASTVGVSSAPGFYTAMFATPVRVKTGDRMFVSMDPAGARASNIVGGTPVSNAYMRPFFGIGAWYTATSTYAPAYKILCEGAGTVGGTTPTTSSSGLPVTGTAYFTVEVNEARQNAPAFLIIGTSNTAYGSATLPFGLGGIGAPGCTLYTSVDVALPILTDMIGGAGVPLPIPNNPWLVGLEFYTQFAIADSWNGLGLVFSDSGAFRIGFP